MAPQNKEALKRFQNFGVSIGKFALGKGEEGAPRHLYEARNPNAQPGPDFPGDSTGAVNQGPPYGQYHGENHSYYNPGSSQGSQGGSGSPPIGASEQSGSPNSPPSGYGQDPGPGNGSNRSWPVHGTGNPYSYPPHTPSQGSFPTYYSPGPEYGGARPNYQSSQSLPSTGQSHAAYPTPGDHAQYATNFSEYDAHGYGQQDMTAPTNTYWPQPPAAAYQQYPPHDYDASGAGYGAPNLLRSQTAPIMGQGFDGNATAQHHPCPRHNNILVTATRPCQYCSGGVT